MRGESKREPRSIRTSKMRLKMEFSALSVLYCHNLKKQERSGRPFNQKAFKAVFKDDLKLKHNTIMK